MSASMSQRRWILPDVGQVLLRFVVVIGAMTAIVAAQAAGARPDLWWQVLLGWLAVLTALRPDSVAGVGLFAGAAYVWSMAPEKLSPLVLLAAAGLVLAHVSALVAAQGPARMSVDGEQVRRWCCAWPVALVLRRGGVGAGRARGRGAPATTRLRARADVADRPGGGHDTEDQHPPRQCWLMGQSKGGRTCENASVRAEWGSVRLLGLGYLVRQSRVMA